MMTIKTPFLINSIHSVNPQQDKRWVPESETEWFLPCMLDFKNNSYSGWWYASKSSHEPQHYHSGISQGTVLNGEIILICDHEEIRLQKNDSFLLPPMIKHTAEIIVENEGFLFFGTIVGNTVYEATDKILNVESYFKMIENYYRNQKIDINHIAIYR